RNSLKSYERLQKLTDLILNLLAVSGSIKPSDIGLFAKPSHLTFGIVPGISLDYTNRLVSCDTGIDIENHMSIADSFAWRHARSHTCCYDLFDFIQQAALHHAAHTLVDTFIEFFT